MPVLKIKKADGTWQEVWGAVTDTPVGGITEQIQSDWNQNDSTQPDFIKNKPVISGLPEVTTDDNDKVMTVVDGTWAAMPQSSGLPEVNTDDVGKFLRVGLDGTWVVEALQDVSEVGM